MFPIGLSSSGKALTRELFAAYRDNGIKMMEICTSWDGYAALDYPLLRSMADEYGITLWSYHLPFNRVDLSGTTTADYAISYYAELIEKASAIGIDKFIVHPSAEPIDPADRAVRMARSKTRLAQLADIASAHGAVIAVEDLPRTCLGRDSDEMLELLDAHPALRVCFDTNHLLYEDAAHFIHQVGDKIVTTHVSDYDGVDERHWLPGEGSTDWQVLIGALRAVGYRGPWLYEIGFRVPKNRPRVRELTCEDFARNARELFAGEAPTVIPMVTVTEQ